MAIKLSNSDQMGGNDRDLRVVLYGPPRTGKTSFAATFPAPVVLIPSLCKEELAVLEGLDIPIYVYDTIDDFRKLAKLLEQDVKSEFKKTGPFRTVIVDNLTVAAQMFLDELDSVSVRNPQRDVWGALSNAILGAYRTLHSIKTTHTIWICHDVIKTYVEQHGREKNTVAYGDFSVPGNAFRDIVTKTCILLHTELATTETKRLYRVWLKKHGIWQAGGWWPRESRKEVSKLDYIGNPKHRNVHYDVLAKALDMPTAEQVEAKLFAE